MKSRAVTFAFAVFAVSHFATAQQWTDRVRGSWLADRDNGKVVLVDGDKVCDIVVPDDANSAIKQAAIFLAGDIEKISGKKPRIVNHATGDMIITLSDGHSDVWESYKIKTFNDQISITGSNFRGTAFGVYTLCERLGVDPALPLDGI